MNIKDFQIALLKNYEKFNGPFNWLADEYELGVFNYLSYRQKKIALHMVYSKYFDTVGNAVDNKTSVEKIFESPTKHQELFELIVCATLVELQKTNVPLSSYSIGDYRLPNNAADTEILKGQFKTLKSAITHLDDTWIIDCKKAWDEVTILNWIERQLTFLDGKIDAGFKNESYIKRSNSSASSNEHFCIDIADYEGLIFEAAQEKLDELVGLHDIKRSLNNLISHIIYNEARTAAHQVTLLPTFNNFIIAGPPGVGKTTVARIVSGILAASGVLKKKSAIFTTTSVLIGEWAGVTEKNVSNLFKAGRGGAIIIDEADTLALDSRHTTQFHEGAINSINTLIGYEKDNNTGTIVILTGYDNGIKRLLNSNQGLRRRFPNYITLPAFESNVFKELFVHMVTLRGYTFGSDVADAALKQIQLAREYMGDNFGNAGTIEEYISVMEAERAKRIGIPTLQRIIRNEITDPDLLKSLSALTLSDTPQFDKETKTFKLSPLSLISSQ